jgi:hypothetical protein
MNRSPKSRKQVYHGHPVPMSAADKRRALNDLPDEVILSHK